LHDFGRLTGPEWSFAELRIVEVQSPRKQHKLPRLPAFLGEGGRENRHIQQSRTDTARTNLRGSAQYRSDLPRENAKDAKNDLSDVILFASFAFFRGCCAEAYRV
jgi:hypothetical protein